MNKISKQDIVIWGCGLEGEKFYWAWRHKVNILYAIDMRYQTLQEFHGIEVRSPQELESLSRYYIVVCVGDESIFSEISGQLKKAGLVEYDNYVRSDSYGDKKLAILYGNCHMDAIERYLKGNVEFARNYRTRLYYVNNTMGECFPTEAAMSKCDLFIAQDINERNVRGLPSSFELKNKIRERGGGKCVIVPNLYGMNLYFPQCQKGEFGRALKQHFEAFNVGVDEGKGKVILRSLDWLNEILDTNISVGGIKSILDINTYSSQEIIDNVEKEISKLEKREELCDITISDFIRSNYRSLKLFYEPYHPAGMLIKEKVKRILKSIGVNNTELNVAVEEMDSKELPVYASVIKALNLQFDCNYIRKSTGNPMNIEEYVQHYIAWEVEPVREREYVPDK